MIFVRQLPFWARALALLGLIAALFGFGYVRGAQAEMERHQVAERKADKVREAALNVALKRGREAARRYAQYRFRTEVQSYARAQEIRDAPTQSLYEVDCSADAAHAAPVRVTWDFVRLWDSAGSPAPLPTDTGRASNAPGELSPLGPRDLLANHEANTTSCEIDRERFRQLIAFIRANHQQETLP